MSALRPKADIVQHGGKCPLCAKGDERHCNKKAYSITPSVRDWSVGSTVMPSARGSGVRAIQAPFD